MHATNRVIESNVGGCGASGNSAKSSPKSSSGSEKSVKFFCVNAGMCGCFITGTHSSATNRPALFHIIVSCLSRTRKSAGQGQVLTQG